MTLAGLDLVFTGAVKVFSLTLDGREVTFDTLGTGGVFGVISLLDGGQQTTSASTLCDSALLFMSHADFLAKIRADEFAHLALLSATADLCRTLTFLLEEQRLDSVETRLARTLVRAVAALGDGDGSVPMTQMQLGSMAGVSRERASRILKLWVASGVLEVGRRRAKVLSHSQLYLLARRRELH